MNGVFGIFLFVISLFLCRIEMVVGLVIIVL